MIRAEKPTPIAGPYRFTIQLPQKMRGDVDNRTKLAADLLVELGVTPDDRHAISVKAERCADVSPYGCVVILESA